MNALKTRSLERQLYEFRRYSCAWERVRWWWVRKGRKEGTRGWGHWKKKRKEGVRQAVGKNSFSHFLRSHYPSPSPLAAALTPSLLFVAEGTRPQLWINKEWQQRGLLAFRHVDTEKKQEKLFLRTWMRDCRWLEEWVGVCAEQLSWSCHPVQARFGASRRHRPKCRRPSQNSFSYNMCTSLATMSM